MVVSPFFKFLQWNLPGLFEHMYAATDKYWTSANKINKFSFLLWNNLFFTNTSYYCFDYCFTLGAKLYSCVSWIVIAFADIWVTEKGGVEERKGKKKTPSAKRTFVSGCQTPRIWMRRLDVNHPIRSILASDVQRQKHFYALYPLPSFNCRLPFSVRHFHGRFRFFTMSKK